MIPTQLRAAWFLVPALLSATTLAAWPGERSDPPAEPSAPSGASSVASAALATYGSHDYYIANLGHPAETDLISHSNGAVFLADSQEIQKTTDGGQTWSAVGLFPTNEIIGIVPEGDLNVAPDGDILTAWLSIDDMYASKIWVSTDGGNTFNFKAAVGPQPFPDRPWIVTSACTPPDPSNPIQPSPYLGLLDGGAVRKWRWVSGDGGSTWVEPLGVSTPLDPLVSFPTLASDSYFDYAKPLGQGFASRYVPLPNGQILDVTSLRLSYDGVQWERFSAISGWPSTGSYTYWDMGSDGTLWAVGLFQGSGSQWEVRYKWYDGSWHDGSVTPTLTAKPDYVVGLDEAHLALAAVKSHGSLLGINTRQGTQDVLIRITDANTNSATSTKELIGGGSSARYDFPNLVFDADGKAVTTFKSSWVAYATTT